MRKALLTAIFLLAAARNARAGEVFGTVSDNGKPPAAGTALKLDCGGVSAAGTTDQFGSYRIKTAATGDCTLTLTYKGSSPSLKVTLFDKPTRYDLVVKEGAGKLTLSRK